MSSEFIFQLFALLIAVIVVHALYVGAIRPMADAQLQQEMELQAAGEDYVPERSFAVVIRDFEQEACFILLIWALAIMGYKGRRTMQEKAILERRTAGHSRRHQPATGGRPRIQPLAGGPAGH